ncbi:hypothetical protein KDH_71230 [Dictyobacter sp. S3.2.2.5]|uniref:Uncharacterized protein n=1 Tax=Dictyobacter halimunensis TaxID=3026934 RepID=A0ABQ6G1B6_9CHLR|nr:hypothetical protein KDH_71230 [Dictyobacter sp. S3.2.2.5]
MQKEKETQYVRGLPPLACLLAARKSNQQNAMHGMQPFLAALKELFLLGSKEAGASPARTGVFFHCCLR